LLLSERGRRIRVYTPFGELLSGMSYLVRRLLENTSNESFLRHAYADDASIEELLRDPVEIGKLSAAGALLEAT
jgi:RHH-type proline utilization regulon transcriptional repressor/proline dehydrogenase/delta 1-pyrroline-5-carboxylate dehydrogenase